MDGNLLDIVVRLATTVFAGGAGAFITWWHRDPYRRVRQAVAVRRELVEAGADPQLWDRVIIGEMSQTLHAATRPNHKIALMTFSVGAVAVVLSMLWLAIAPALKSSLDAVLTYVYPLVILVVGFAFMLRGTYVIKRAADELPMPFEDVMRLPEHDPRRVLTGTTLYDALTVKAGRHPARSVRGLVVAVLIAVGAITGTRGVAKR